MNEELYKTGTIIPMFPTPIGCYNIGRDITESELDFMFNLHTQQNLITTRGHTTRSIDGNVLENPALSSIKEFLQHSVNDYFMQTYCPIEPENVSVYITQSWVNYSKPNESHHKHFHSNSFISGVFYPKADPADTFTLYNEKIHPFHIIPGIYNPWNSKEWTLKVNTGLLILIPSDFNHGVRPNQGEHTRISLSFNTFIKGKVGVAADSTELIL